MAHGPGLLLKLFAALVVVMVAALACATWFFFKRPLMLDDAMSRFALSQAGLLRSEILSDLGPQTVFEGGSGPPLILVHAEGGQAGAWTRIVTPLIEQYHVAIPDLAGHGKSAPADGPIDVDSLVRGLEAVIDTTFGDDPVILVGHSLGALVTFIYAERHPDRVERLIAVNGGPVESNATSIPVTPRDRDDARLMMDALMGTPADAIPGHVLADIVRRTHRGPAARLEQNATSMGGFSFHDRLATFEIPVQLVWGEADELFDADYARELCNQLPSCRLNTIPGCGHWPQRECPVETVEALKEALQSRDR